MSNKRQTSLGKALHLLRLLGARNGWTGVRDLARQAGYTPTSTHGLLQVLLGNGFVAYDAERRQYALGIAVLALADRIDAGDTLAAFAQPHVAALAAELAETVYAISWRGGAALVIAGIEPERELRVGLGGRVIERPDVWASGRVLLAWLSAPEREAYLKRIGKPGLAAELDTIHAAGWAETSDVDGSGVVAYGAPVLDAGGRCLLALGTSAPLSRASAAVRKRLRQRLLATATAMSTTLAPESA